MFDTVHLIRFDLIKPFFLFLTAFPLLPSTVQLGSGPTKLRLTQFIHFLKAGKTAGARLLQTFSFLFKQGFEKLSPLRVSQPLKQTLNNNRNLEICSGHTSTVPFNLFTSSSSSDSMRIFIF